MAQLNCKSSCRSEHYIEQLEGRIAEGGREGCPAAELIEQQFSFKALTKCHDVILANSRSILLYYPHQVIVTLTLTWIVIICHMKRGCYNVPVVFSYASSSIFYSCHSLGRLVVVLNKHTFETCKLVSKYFVPILIYIKTNSWIFWHVCIKSNKLINKISTKYFHVDFSDISKRLNFQDFAALKLFAKWCDLITKENYAQEIFPTWLCFSSTLPSLTSLVASFATVFSKAFSFGHILVSVAMQACS